MKLTKAAFLVLSFSLSVLTVIYISRLLNMGNLQNYVIATYGIVVTPLVIFKLIAAYTYKPIPDMGYRPMVSVIIPVLNEEKMIGFTVDALLLSNYLEDKLEIIVVNDGSTDSTGEVLSKIKGIKVITFKKNRGKRFAFATGVEQAKGEILVCVDSDSIVEQDAIANLVQPFANPEVQCVCGHGEVLNKDENFLTHSQRVWYADSFRILKSMESMFGMVTCCSGLLAAYRKQAINNVIQDWLNEKFLGRQVLDSDDRTMTNLMLRLQTFCNTSDSEDRTLTAEAMKPSFSKSKYQSNAVAYTVVPDNIRQFIKQQLRWGRGSFRGMIFASSFFWRRPIKQSSLFYLLVLVNYLSPVTLLINLVILPLLGFPLLAIIYIAGLFFIHFIHGLNSQRLVANYTLQDIIYRTLFVTVTLLISVVYLYGWATAMRGKKWMTR